MKFPLFRREKSSAAAREAQAKLEKALAQAFRALGQVFAKMGDTIEAQRLERAGYEEQEKFLTRLDKGPKDGGNG